MLIAVGALIALLSGGCTLRVVYNALNAPPSYVNGLDLPLALLFGLPTVGLGMLLLWFGVRGYRRR